MYLHGLIRRASIESVTIMYLFAVRMLLGFHTFMKCSTKY